MVRGGGAFPEEAGPFCWPPLDSPGVGTPEVLLRPVPLRRNAVCMCLAFCGRIAIRPGVLHVRKTNSRGQLSASHYHPSNPAWPASGESRVVGASMERELPTASWPTPLTPSPPSSACWLGKGAGTSRPCWMPIEGPAASCTLRTLFKTVPPLRKYWSCSGAKISELAISQISLCKRSLPPDRLTSVQAFVENVPSVGAHVLCSLLAASSRRGGRHGTLLS